MLEALGVETSKTFSLIETGEALERNDEPSPTRSAVLVRLQHSHIRIGTFQRLAYARPARQSAQAHRLLPAPLLWRTRAATRPGCSTMSPPSAARLAASYIAAGFVHGVLNSRQYRDHRAELRLRPVALDALLGREFHRRLFRPSGPLCLRPPARGDPLGPGPARRLAAQDRRGRAAHRRARNLPASASSAALARALFARLGIVPRRARRGSGAGRRDRGGACREQTVTIDRFFFDWRGGRASASGYERVSTRSRALVGRYAPVPGALDHEYWSDAAPCSMHIEEVEAIWSAIAEADDWAPFHAKIAAVRRMGEAHDGRRKCLKNPRRARHECAAHGRA